MEITEIFKELLKHGKHITEKTVKELKGKSFYSDYQVGDKICYFMIQSSEFVNKNGLPTINLRVQIIVERELDLLEKDPEYEYERTSSDIPIFIKKG